MKPESERGSLLGELKDYLIFMKDAGYREIPVGTDLDLCKINKGAPTDNSPAPVISHTAPGETEIGTPSLAKVRDELGDCARCKLSDTRKTIVFGSGNPNADLVFVGEGPGADEDEQGLPFVGRAGKKLTEIMKRA